MLYFLPYHPLVCRYACTLLGPINAYAHICFLGFHSLMLVYCIRTMARCCYETLVLSRTFPSEGVREDVDRALHVEAPHCNVRIPGKSPADSPENPYYRAPSYRSALSAEFDGVDQ